jgi:uncharacterized protein (UPF0332 family)
LAQAARALQTGLPGIAAREAYLAALSAGRGLVFEFRDKGPKTHSGVKSLMHELVQGGIGIDRLLLAIFDDGFELKVEADYGNPLDITDEDANRTIRMAQDLIEQIDRILEARP